MKIRYNLERVKLLLDEGVNINTRCPYEENALVLAIIGNNVEIARLLLERGSDVNLVNWSGYGAIHYTKNNLELIQLLVDYGPKKRNINIKSDHETTDLSIAKKKDRHDVIDYLRDHGTID